MSNRTVTREGQRPCRAEVLEPRRLLSATTLPRDVNATPVDGGALIVEDLYDPDAEGFGHDQHFEHVTYQGQLYFVHEDGVHGIELFRSDGTAGGTVLVKDIKPGREDAYPSRLTVVNGLLYFMVADGPGGASAWRTDGTEAGTVRLGGPGGVQLITAFAPGPDGSTLFGASDYRRAEIWRTDGTPGGTTLLKALPTASFGGGFAEKTVAAPGATYFLANDSVWRSDGTAAGTYSVKQFQLYPDGPSPVDMAFADGRLFVVTRFSTLFYAEDSLYVLDGTVGNATLLKHFPMLSYDPPATGNVQSLTVVGDTVYFSADDGTSGDELWAATATGVRRVKDINPGAAGSNPSDFAAYHGALYFAATTVANGTELWTSDGTSVGTRRVTDLSTGGASSSPGALAVVNDKIFFSVVPDGSTTRTGLFTSDGTAGGTQLVRWFDESDTVTWQGDVVRYRPTGFAPVSGGNVLFTARDDSAGAEIWVTDGSAVGAGTHVVRDLYPGTQDANPVFLGTLGGRLVFFADDGIHGAEPWSTDGTAAGTALVKDVRPGAASSGSAADGNGNGPESPGVATSQYVFFTAADGTGQAQAWRTDGTAAGTVKLTTSLPGEITAWSVVDDRAYFRVGSGASAVYYTSDGTPAGTGPAPGPNGTFPFMPKLGNARYGVGTDAANGAELYRYEQDPLDPNVITATRVADVNPGPGGSDPKGIAVVGDKVFFFAADAAGSGNKLYAYTPAGGAVLVRDVAVGDDDFLSNSSFAVVGGKYFFAGVFRDAPSSFGRELFVSDGTFDGTRMVVDLAPGSYTNSNPVNFLELNGTLLFTTSTSFPTALYRTDGTAAGTVRLADDIAFRQNTSSAALARVGSDVYFFSGTYPYAKLWKTNGTPQGTTLVAAPNAAGQLAAAGNKLFFPVLDFLHGFETWTTTVDGEPPLFGQSATFTPAGGAASGITVRASRPLAGEVEPASYSRLDLKVTAEAGGTVITTARVLRRNADGSISFTFPGGLPPDGRYHAVLPAGSVFDTSGTPLAKDFVFEFVVLRGDADGDGAVGAGDFNVLASHFGQSGQTWATGDFTGDGVVGPEDFNLLASRFGTSFAAPVPLGSPAPVAGAATTPTTSGPTKTTAAGGNAIDAGTRAVKPRTVPRTPAKPVLPVRPGIVVRPARAGLSR